MHTTLDLAFLDPECDVIPRPRSRGGPQKTSSSSSSLRSPSLPGVSTSIPPSPRKRSATAATLDMASAATPLPFSTNNLMSGMADSITMPVVRRPSDQGLMMASEIPIVRDASNDSISQLEASIGSQLEASIGPTATSGPLPRLPSYDLPPIYFDMDTDMMNFIETNNLTSSITSSGGLVFTSGITNESMADIVADDTSQSKLQKTEASLNSTSPVLDSAVVPDVTMLLTKSERVSIPSGDSRNGSLVVNSGNTVSTSTTSSDPVVTTTNLGIRVPDLHSVLEEDEFNMHTTTSLHSSSMMTKTGEKRKRNVFTDQHQADVKPTDSLIIPNSSTGSTTSLSSGIRHHSPPAAVVPTTTKSVAPLPPSQPQASSSNNNTNNKSKYHHRQRGAYRCGTCGHYPKKDKHDCNEVLSAQRRKQRNRRTDKYRSM